MADLGLDVDALRRDRDRYRALLTQAEEQISAWNERADFVQQAIGGIDQLLTLAGHDGATDAGPARQLLPGRGVSATAPAPSTSVKKRPAPPTKKPAPRPLPPPSQPAGAKDDEPAAPAGSSGVAPDAPKGTDAVRIVLEDAPDRAFSLAELLTELEERRWLAPSRRPEELVRINLKRLAERGGAMRTDDGRWSAATGGPGPAPTETTPAETAPAEATLPEATTPETALQPSTPPADPPPVVGSSVREW